MPQPVLGERLINPHAYLTDVLTRLVNNWPNYRLGELLPWSWTPERS
jgi:hypothetical protein